MLKYLAFVFFSVFCLIGFSQEWEVIEPQPYHNSAVKVEVCNKAEEQQVLWQGSGVVIYRFEGEAPKGYYYGLIGTAAHVVTNESGKLDFSYDIKLYFQGGKITKCNQVLSVDPNYLANKSASNDGALIYGLVPIEVPFVEVSDVIPKPGEEVEFYGYGGGDSRLFKAKFAGRDGLLGTSMFMTWVVSGDSGGPIYYKGKVLSVISGGEIWIEQKFYSESGNKVGITFPTKGCSTEVLRNLLKNVLDSRKTS